MGYIQAGSSAYINPQHIVSINLETKSKLYIKNEYRDNAEFITVYSYELVIKMVNGDIYTEYFNDLKEATQRRTYIYSQW